MSDEKISGSYYTPYDVITFMMNYLEKEKQDFRSVLEPSAGDGRFLSLLLKKAEHIDAVELFEEKVYQIQKKYTNENLEVIHKDFIQFATEKQADYSLIIGNPPYINLKVMEREDIKKARELCKIERLAESAMQNMWLAFVVGASRLVAKEGTIFFVLPMEFLQVQYAEKLRGYLEKKFNTIHIITFRETLFEGIEQEVCLVYLANKQRKEEHILYEIYETVKIEKALHINLIKKNKPLQKWSNAILSDEEISLLKGQASQWCKVGTMGTVAPGIVTGGNKFFILTEEQVKKYNCEKYVLPIVQKSSFVDVNTMEINEEVLEKIKNVGKPVFLLDLAKAGKKLPKALQAYLEWSGEQEVQGIRLKERYKCANRDPWYGVPIANKGDVIFFKRYHILPRLYLNKANVHTTDAGYHIRLSEKYEADSFVFCFFNSLTLATCEYNGRYYGGGVSELVPSEFKNITVPYQKIAEEHIKELKEKFKAKVSIDEIVAFVNDKTIGKILENEQIEKLEEIRKKLILRRISSVRQNNV